MLEAGTVSADDGLRARAPQEVPLRPPPPPARHARALISARQCLISSFPTRLESRPFDNMLLVMSSSERKEYFLGSARKNKNAVELRLECRRFLVEGGREMRSRPFLRSA